MSITSEQHAAAEPSAQRARRIQAGQLISRARRLGGPIAGLIILSVFLTFASPYFLTSHNLSNILSQSSDIGIMAAGEALVILVGGIDLSVAATLAFTIMVEAWLFKEHGFPFPVALVAGLVLGGLVGVLNGVLSTYGRVQPFVATLATMSAATGMALVVTNGNTLNGFPTWFSDLSATAIAGIPLQAIIMIVIYLVLAMWLRYRPAGRALYAIGGNEEVARLSGLKVQMLKIWVYVIAGGLATIAGWIDISTLDSAQPTTGSTYLLNVIAVVVIGGASLSGGVASMGSTFIGLLIIGVLNNGLSLLHVNPNLQSVVVGGVILAAVLTDRASIRLRS